MQKRVSHSKSRRGCSNCKKRHVKCDEQGPPCANCIVRDCTSTCSYGQNGPDAGARLAPSSNRSTPRRGSSEDVPKHGRLLELEMMHRWTSSTYRSLCMVPEDHHFMQVEVPRDAFTHEFLLHAILALSGLEAACEERITSPTSDIYVPAALSHYDSACEAFRARIGDITPESQHAIYTFTILVTIFNIGIPNIMLVSTPEPQPLMGRLHMLFELSISAASISQTNWSWLMSSPAKASIVAAMSFMNVQKGSLGPAQPAIERLARVVDAALPDMSGTMDQDGYMALQDSYRKAASLLQMCFLEDPKDSIKGFGISFPMFTGYEFAVAFRELRPMALFIVMHWGVLLDKLSNMIWWAKSAGSSLVHEVSEILVHACPDTSLSLDWHDSISWARHEVGLQSLDVHIFTTIA